MQSTVSRRRVTVRILLAEDDPQFGSIVAEGLREHDYAVDLVTDGATARDHATQTTYDVVILDARMPTLDGLAVCRLLRTHGMRAPVLIMSAGATLPDGTPIDRTAALAAGANDYLVKPFAFPDFVARLRALLTGGKITSSNSRDDWNGSI